MKEEQMTIQEYIRSLNQERKVEEVTQEELITLLQEVTPEDIALSQELEDEPTDGEIIYTVK